MEKYFLYLGKKETEFFLLEEGIWLQLQLYYRKKKRQVDIFGELATWQHNITLCV